MTRGTLKVAPQNRPPSDTVVHPGSETVNVRGGSREKRRGSYCTPRYVADTLPTFELDPFSNERSHIRAAVSLTLERSDDGYGIDAATAGSYFRAASNGPHAHRGHRGAFGHATPDARVWLQPDYNETLLAWRHYRHTRWIALLRFDPRTEWFELVYSASEWVGVLPNSPGKSSFEFDKPPGAEHGAGNTFPHALYARYAEDVMPGMLELCSLPTGSSLSWRKKSRT